MLVGNRVGGRWPLLRRVSGGWAAFSDRVATWSLAGMTLLCSVGLTQSAARHGVAPGVAVATGYALTVGLVCMRSGPRSRVLASAHRAAYLLGISTVCLVAVIQARRGMVGVVLTGAAAAEVVGIAAVLAAVLPRLRSGMSHMLASAWSAFNHGEKP